MQIAFGMLMFFGGPLVLLIGLIKPSIYRGGRLRALGAGLAVSAIGLAGALAVTSPAEWEAIRERSEQRRVQEAEQAARQTAEREVARQEEARAQAARDEQQRREREERQAAEARAQEERRAADAQRATAERARRQSEAEAAERARGPDRLRRAGGGDGRIAVWRSSASMDEAMRLINANVHRTNPVMLMPHVACMAAQGTEIVVTDGGFFSSSVLVVSGGQSGCRGVVPNEDIERRR